MDTPQAACGAKPAVNAMKDLSSLMKQAQAMQQKLQDAQAKLAATLVEGTSGGGMVKLSITGSG